MVLTPGCCASEHELAIMKEINRLKNLGYICEREYIIFIGGGKGAGYRLVVDIRAKKGEKELLIEVGTLSNIHGKRLELLKKLCPRAKIIHITQWKNWLNSFDWFTAEEHRRTEEYRWKHPNEYSKINGTWVQTIKEE